MKVRAVIFDVYQTVLEVAPPPAAAAQRWRTLWTRIPGRGPRPSLEEFTARCEAVIRRERATARDRGIAWPEVYWPQVAVEAAPALRALEGAALEDWLFAHAQMVRTVRLAPGAGNLLRSLVPTGLGLGVASNAQPYTWRELDGALAEVGMSRACFDPALCFWSFAHGFSKPDPHVFRVLTARLAARGIPADAALMVGDRLDNDIQPALRAGWQAWHLRSPDPTPGQRLDGRGFEGDWPALGGFLSRELEGPVARRFSSSLSPASTSAPDRLPAASASSLKTRSR